MNSSNKVDIAGKCERGNASANTTIDLLSAKPCTNDAWSKENTGYTALGENCEETSSKEKSDRTKTKKTKFSVWHRLRRRVLCASNIDDMDGGSNTGFSESTSTGVTSKARIRRRRKSLRGTKPRRQEEGTDTSKPSRRNSEPDLTKQKNQQQHEAAEREPDFKRLSSSSTKGQSARAQKVQHEPKLPDQRVVGLTNRGNTCYFNSAMQMVIYTPYLKELIDEVLNSGRHNSMKMTVAFSKVLAAAEKNSEKLDFATNGLLKVVFETSTRFKEYSQQDMHELWRLILNRIKDEEQEQKMDKRKISGERETPLSMDRIFGGHFITVYVCDNCTLPYHLCEPFIDISIPVIYESDKSFNLNEEDRENNRKGLLGDHTEMRDYCSAMDSIVKPLKGGTTVGGTELNEGKLKTIEEGLACLTRTEQLEGGFLCRKCANEEYARNPEATSDEMSTTATKKLAIFNLPAILTINLKRFQFTDDGRFQKVRHPVKFDEILDLGPFCSKYIMNPANSTVYELYGVVEHHGSLDGGHYTAYVKVPVSHGDPKRQKLSKQEYQEIISARRHRVRGNLQKKDEVDIGDANEPQTIVSIVNKLREKAREKKGRKKMQQGLENTIEPAPQVLANVNWQWYHISDSFFSKVSFDEVQRAEAFLLFYERR